VSGQLHDPAALPSSSSLANGEQIFRSRISSTLKMEDARSSETSVLARCKGHHIPEGEIFQLILMFTKYQSTNNKAIN
jgi:hypothetical protein